MTRLCITLLLYVTFAVVSLAATPIDHAIAPGFESNLGQIDPQVRFLVRKNGMQFFLTSSKAVMAIAGAHGTGSSVRMRLAGSNPHANVQAVDLLPGSSNYFIGRQRHTKIPRFAGVRYQSVYPGIDLVYRVTGGDIEFDFDVAPGADPGQDRTGLCRRYEPQG